MELQIFDHPPKHPYIALDALRAATGVVCTTCGQPMSDVADALEIETQVWWANHVLLYGHRVCFACFSVLPEREQNKLMVEHWMHMAGVPPSEAGARFDNFERTSETNIIYEPVEQWYRTQDVNSTFLALLSSQKGIGKTRLAVSAMAEYFVDHAGINLRMKSGLLAPYITDKTFLFLKERDLSMCLRSAYDKLVEYNERDILKELYAVDFLVLDDLLSNKKSDFDRQIFLNVLDHRMDEEGKRTIFTSNHTLAEIEQLDDRISSRLRDVHKGRVLSIERLRIPDYRTTRVNADGGRSTNVVCL